MCYSGIGEDKDEDIVQLGLEESCETVGVDDDRHNVEKEDAQSSKEPELNKKKLLSYI
jgi:hypothetical protein